MSSKIRLGKTKDSRTRKQKVKAVDILAAQALKIELSAQKNFVDYLLLKGYSTSTTKRYVTDSENFLKWIENENIEITQVNYSDILHYIQGKRRKIQQRTISLNIISLKHYFNFLAITNQNLTNPTLQIKIKGIRRRKLYQILSKQELERLYDDFETLDYEDINDKNKNQNWFINSVLANKRDKIILGLIIYQGLGTTELSRLKVNDVKLRDGKIFISGTRRSNERELKLEAHQIMDMMEYKLKIRDKILKIKKHNSDNLLISTGSSNRLSNSIQSLMKKLREYNSKITSLKQIRTSVITHWLKIHNLRQVQYMAGHRYVSSTEAYLINDLEDLSEEVNKYHPI